MSRLVPIAALVVATVAVAVIFLGGDSYRVKVQIVDAGQVVKGGLVQVSGRKVGKIESIDLSNNGHAELTLAIDEPEYQPLHRGTIAQVRAVGLVGVANRFVDLVPGPDSAEAIDDGGVMTTAETRPIIDLDVLFNSLDDPTLKRLQRIIKNGGDLFAGDAAQNANQAFGYLTPALAQSSLLAEELTRDKVAVRNLIRDGSKVAGVFADRRTDVSQGIASTAVTLRALASEREALADSLSRAPAILNRPGGPLGEVRKTVNEIRPALREAREVAPPLAEVLKLFVPTSRATRPVLADVRGLLPELRTGMNTLPALADVAVPGLNSTTRTGIALLPVVDGLRPYTPDLIGGLVNGLGKASGYYDANGTYGRISLNGGTTSLTGLIGGVVAPVVGGNAGYLTGHMSRCPGAAEEAAPDGSNPFVENPANCDESQNKK